MTQQHRVVSRRALVGLALGLWVAFLSCATLRAQADGPQWGLQLTQAADGRVFAGTLVIREIGDAAGIRGGEQILSVDGDSPTTFVGPNVPNSVHEIVFLAGDGAQRTVSFAEMSASTLAFLDGGALLFVIVGAIVYRWSADAPLGRVFLLLSGSFATALAAAPGSRAGNPVLTCVVSGAGLIAQASLLLLFMLFPRRMRSVRQAMLVLYGTAAVLFAGQLAETRLPTATASVIDTATWLWSMLTLLGGVVVLSLRARSATDRRALSPLLIGLLVAVLPLVALSALPQLMGAPGIAPELAGVAMAAIPLSFAYTILRHQIFGLDALMRRVVQRASIAVVSSACFFAIWYALQALALGAIEAALVATVGCGLIMPKVAEWTRGCLDAWLYPVLSASRTLSALADVESLTELGTLVSVRLRQVLPIMWSACLIHDDTTPTDAASRRVLGSDGLLPSWLDHSSLVHQSPTAVSVTPVHRFDTGVVLLVAGPRLDGAPLDAIQLDAMRMLARAAAASAAAALLRERAEEEATFRQGVVDLAHDLAAAATVSDVMRAFSEHAARLLHADSASLAWDELEPLEPSTSETNCLQFQLDSDSERPIVCRIERVAAPTRFGAREEVRARELGEHTMGALRRAAEREILEEQLRHRAFYDSLTGLPNRALFLDRLGHALARGERLGGEVAVLFIDLDRFKVVNDSMGHTAGDQLLVAVGARLRQCLRESDTIARLGGDEFTVLLEGPTALTDATGAAQRILATLDAPFVLEGREAYASASIGIAGGTAVRAPSRDLLREADIALYRAKASGRAGFVVYEQRMSHSSDAQMDLESDLHRAIERGELRVYYQPIFSLRDSRVTGLEALLRWEHPEKGMISPARFIPLAEETGLIVPIGKWVLEEACRQMRSWDAQHASARDLFVSVNLSARQLRDPNLVDDVRQTIRASGISPRRVHLEITESVVMHDPEVMMARLEALKALGIKLAVDDFGTGYSSLAYLKQFPIDVLKIDRAFVSGLANGEHDAAIVQTVISLARALGLRTTAEGIEERSQWDRLEQLGCDQGQGFIFSKPQPAAAIEEQFLTDDQAPLSAAA